MRVAMIPLWLRVHWRLALRCSVVSLIVTVALAGNVYFYAAFGGGWLRLAAILVIMDVDERVLGARLGMQRNDQRALRLVLNEAMPP